MGAISYLLLVSMMGVPLTGFFGMGSHVLLYSSCVASIWLPGSLTSLSFHPPPATNHTVEGNRLHSTRW